MATETCAPTEGDPSGYHEMASLIAPAAHFHIRHAIHFLKPGTNIADLIAETTAEAYPHIGPKDRLQAAHTSANNAVGMGIAAFDLQRGFISVTEETLPALIRAQQTASLVKTHPPYPIPDYLRAHDLQSWLHVRNVIVGEIINSSLSTETLAAHVGRERIRKGVLPQLMGLIAGGTLAANQPWTRGGEGKLDLAKLSVAPQWQSGITTFRQIQKLALSR